MKTSKTASKRFKITGSGALLRRRATRAHKLIGKPSDRKRAYTKDHAINTTQTKTVKKMLGIK
ncbi:MAG: 50S ribosomal protein L35 [bacterium]